MLLKTVARYVEAVGRLMASSSLYSPCREARAQALEAPSLAGASSIRLVRCQFSEPCRVCMFRHVPP